MDDDDEKSLKTFVEDKIMKITFRAKNFDAVEMNRVDNYCKLHFGDDRKKMILGLITMMENNSLISSLDGKINALSANVGEELNNIYKQLNELTIEDPKDKPTETNRVSWKGFKRD